MLRQALLLLAALIIGSAFLIWIEGYSSTFQNCMHLSAPLVSSYFHCTERFADAHNALITAIATFLLAIVTLGLILGAIDQQNTTRAQLRAYLLPDKVSVVAAGIDGKVIVPNKQIEVGTQPIVCFEWKNYGQTPAFDVKMAGNVCLTKWPIDPSSFPPLDREQGSSQILGPGGTTLKFEISEKPLILSDAGLQRLQAGELAFVAFGEVTYRDTFNRKHCTRYRYFTGGPPGVRGTMMSAHDEGNTGS